MDALEFKPRTVNLTAVHFTAEHPDPIAALTAKLNSVPPDFFTGVGMVADLSAYPKRDIVAVQAMKNAFAAVHLSLVGIIGAECEDNELGALGLARISAEKPRESYKATRAKPPANGSATPSTSLPPQESNTAPAVPAGIPSKVVRGNVRSGQRVYAAGGDLIIIGAVGEGAEVIADGNIHILGPLRGRAFAGANGEHNAHIFVAEFAAELISIAGNYQNEEQLDRYKGGKNCLITLNKDETMLIVSL